MVSGRAWSGDGGSSGRLDGRGVELALVRVSRILPGHAGPGGYGRPTRSPAAITWEMANKKMRTPGPLKRMLVRWMRRNGRSASWWRTARLAVCILATGPNGRRPGRPRGARLRRPGADVGCSGGCSSPWLGTTEGKGGEPGSVGPGGHRQRPRLPGDRAHHAGQSERLGTASSSKRSRPPTSAAEDRIGQPGPVGSEQPADRLRRLLADRAGSPPWLT